MARTTAIAFSLDFSAPQTQIGWKCCPAITKPKNNQTKSLDKEMKTKIIKIKAWTMLRPMLGYEGKKDRCRRLITRHFASICSLVMNLSDLWNNGWLLRTTEKLYDLLANFVLIRTLVIWFSSADRQIWRLPRSKPLCKPIQSISSSKIRSRLKKSYDRVRFKWIKTKHGDTLMVSSTGTIMQCYCRENFLM